MGDKKTFRVRMSRPGRAAHRVIEVEYTEEELAAGGGSDHRPRKTGAAASASAPAFDPDPDPAQGSPGPSSAPQRSLGQPPACAGYQRTFGHVLLRGRPRSRFVWFPAYGVMEVVKGHPTVESPLDVFAPWDHIDVTLDPARPVEGLPAPVAPIVQMDSVDPEQAAGGLPAPVGPTVEIDSDEHDRRFDPRSPLEQALSDRRAGLRT